MQAFRFSRQIAVWWALAAMLMMSFAPTVSHVLQGQAGSNWVELCTALGSKWVRIADDGRAVASNNADALAASTPQAEATAPGDSTAPPAPSIPTHVFEHCPYCALHAHDLAPLPALPALALRVLGFEAPRLFLAAPRTLHAWLAAQPRGPPTAA